MKTIANNPAYPLMPSHTDPNQIMGENYQGMTIRQQFAAMAMQGLLANSAVTFPFGYPELIKSIAADSVMHADALIAALNEGGENG